MIRSSRVWTWRLIKVHGPEVLRQDDVVNEQQILEQVRSLVDQEHELRARVQDGALAPEEEQDQLRRLERALDQCWDLLRQRRARHDAGQDADDAVVRPAGQVEDYQQ